MKISTKGITSELETLEFSSTDSWLEKAVSAVDEAPEAGTGHDARLKLDLYRAEDLVIMKGAFRGGLRLLCSRCADPFPFDARIHFKCLFTEDKEVVDATEAAAPVVKPSEDDGDEDVDIEFLDKDHIELGEVVKEQLYLRLPLQPLCQEGCKGLCPTCGQNQNTNPCQCHRLKAGTMARQLQKLGLARGPQV
jgi:uncharacterized protein